VAAVSALPFTILTVLAAVLAAPPGDGRGADNLEVAWADLGTDNPVTADRAMRALAARPERAVPFLRRRLEPVPAPDPRRLARLLAELDSEEFAQREEATRELGRLAGGPSPEARRRIDGLLDRLREERLRPSAERRRAVRAVEVLEQVGDAGAREGLAALARGAPEAQLTVEAKTALERLARRPALIP
jgi:hypothetical protein